MSLLGFPTTPTNMFQSCTDFNVYVTQKSSEKETDDKKPNKCKTAPAANQSNSKSEKAPTKSTASNQTVTPESIQICSTIYHLWQMPVRFGSNTFNCYLDSGAMMCVMRKDTYDMLDAKANPLEPFPGNVYGISNKAQKVYGQGNLPYAIDGNIFHASTVVADVTPAALLGLNFLVENGAVVNYQAGRLSLNNKEYALSTKNESRPRRMTLINNVMIKPFTETTIELKPKSGCKLLRSDMVISPLRDTMRRTGLVMGHTCKTY